MYTYIFAYEPCYEPEYRGPAGSQRFWLGPAPAHWRLINQRPRPSSADLKYMAYTAAACCHEPETTRSDDRNQALLTIVDVCT